MGRGKTGRSAAARIKISSPQAVRAQSSRATLNVILQSDDVGHRLTQTTSRAQVVDDLPDLMEVDDDDDDDTPTFPDVDGDDTFEGPRPTTPEDPQVKRNPVSSYH
jgi:hypothetical protein